MNPRFTAWQQKALWQSVPLTASLELTHSCNLRCDFCCNRRSTDRSSLTAVEWVAVLDDLRKLGTLFVTLTGGEPLAHPEFFAIATAARDRALAVRILTNGTLIDDETAQRIARLRPLSVELSLHGASAETHDATTGVEGSHAAVIAALDRLLEHQLNLVLKTPVTTRNRPEIEGIIEMATDRGIPCVIDPSLTPRDDGEPVDSRHEIKQEGLETLFATLDTYGLAPDTKRVKGGANCGLGRSTLTIDPKGDVFPCVLWRSMSYGNVRERPLPELWRSRERHWVADVSTVANDHLLSLDQHLSRYPFCPALAERTGDPTQPYGRFRELAAAAFQARTIGETPSAAQRSNRRM